MEHFVLAVQALSAPETDTQNRKAAEAWLVQFSRSVDSWGVALELVGSPQRDVAVLAGQALKNMARLHRAQPRELCQQRLLELLQLLVQRPDLPAPAQLQVVLAVSHVSLAWIDTATLQHMAQLLAESTLLLVMETLAEEGSSLEAFGPGSADERTQAVSHIKAHLRSQAPTAYSLLARIAITQHATPSAAPQQRVSQHGTRASWHAQPLPTKLLSCLQAWVKFSGVQSMSPHDSQALVNMTLSHVQDLSSPAFSVSGEVLCALLDHCPPEWLPGLHDPLMRIAQTAIAAADGGHPEAADALCRVVASYASLAVDLRCPSPPSRACEAREALLRLALLPAVGREEGGDTGDPVCCPALATWALLAEQATDSHVAGYDVREDSTLMDSAHDAARGIPSVGGTSAPPDALRSFPPASGFTTAASLLHAQECATPDLPDHALRAYEQVLYGVLHNTVGWQRLATPNTTYADAFTPTFTATLSDCLASCCAVLGPSRYMRALSLLMDRPATDPHAAPATAAAMTAIAAAGPTRVSRDPAALHALAACLVQAAALPLPPGRSPYFLAPFTCASASCGRACLRVCATAAAAGEGGEGGRHAAVVYLRHTVDKALVGLSLPDDGQATRTPAGLAVRQMMAGAQDVGLPVPRELIQAMSSALQRLGVEDGVAEQAIVTALVTGLDCMAGGLDAQRAARRAAYEELTTPALTALSHIRHALLGGRAWADLRERADTQLVPPLRRLAHLLAHCLPSEDLADAEPPADDGMHTCSANGHATPPAKSPDAMEGLHQLAGSFLGSMWPLLCGCLQTSPQVSGEWLAPVCKCLTLLIRAQVPGLHDRLPGMVELLASLLFRPQGKHAADACVAFLTHYGTLPQAQPLCHGLAHAVLTAPRAVHCAEWRAADQDPDLAEALLRVASSYVRNVLVPAQDPPPAPPHPHASSAGGAGSPGFGAPHVGHVIALAAACSCANHRGVSSAALTTLAALLSAARSAAAGAEATGGPQQGLACAVASQGHVLVAALIGSLMAVSPLGRVHKVQALLVDLAALSRTVPPPPAPPAAGIAPVAGARALPTLTLWLVAAGTQLQLPEGEARTLLSAVPAACAEVLAAEGGEPRQQLLAGKRLKKLLRDFAEVHSRVE